VNGLKQLQARNQQNTTLNPNLVRDLSQNLERQMEARLQTLVNQMMLAGLDTEVSAPAQPDVVPEMTIAQPVAPTPPKVEQKVVRLVETRPAAPTVEPAPTKQMDPDVAWLKAQATENYVLQLASMSDRESLQKIITDKKILGARIVPQIREGNQTYILLVGSHPERTDANQHSIRIKKDTGISPWVRRVKDVTNRIGE
jgi:septal ring-binding cell division protein DamX